MLPQRGGLMLSLLLANLMLADSLSTAVMSTVVHNFAVCDCLVILVCSLSGGWSGEEQSSVRRSSEAL